MFLDFQFFISQSPVVVKGCFLQQTFTLVKSKLHPIIKIHCFIYPI